MTKFFRKYGLCVAFAFILAAVFGGGYATGRAHCKDVPVFIEVPSPTVEKAETNTEPIADDPVAEQAEVVEQVTVTATAYCACEKCCGVWATKRPLDEDGDPIVYTASGSVAKANHTIAVDPDVFPYGTVLEIGGVEYVAEDCGGAIKGNRIDVYFDSHQAARKFGRQTLTATIVK